MSVGTEQKEHQRTGSSEGGQGGKAERGPLCQQGRGTGRAQIAGAAAAGRAKVWAGSSACAACAYSRQSGTQHRRRAHGGGKARFVCWLGKAGYRQHSTWEEGWTVGVQGQGSQNKAFGSLSVFSNHGVVRSEGRSTAGVWQGVARRKASKAKVQMPVREEESVMGRERRKAVTRADGRNRKVDRSGRGCLERVSSSEREFQGAARLPCSPPLRCCLQVASRPLAAASAGAGRP